MSLPQTCKARFAPLVLAPLIKMQFRGEVDLSLIGDGVETYRAYLRQVQQHTHGMALIEIPDKVGAQRNRFWLATARVDGEVVGVMLYDLKGEREGEFNLHAVRFYYHTSAGRYLLLQWIARHIDQANRVELNLAPTELPETWLTDMNVAVETADLAPMGRVVDVAAIGGMRTGPGRFAAHISDSLCPWNEGNWRFETVDGLLQVAPAQEVGCELSIQGLSALVYGPYDPADLPIRGWGNPTVDVQDRMRAMFPRLLPYIHELF
jgi:predicted acetyltransferase